MSTTQTQAQPTTHFELQKGQKFNIDKGITKVRLGLGWNVATKAGENFDPDASVMGLIHMPSGNPKLYGNGDKSYAVCYANEDIKKPDGKLITFDEAIIHSGDDRSGGKGEDDEVITIDLNKVQPEITELAVWVTIYEAHKRNQNFGLMTNSYIKITDVSNNQTPRDIAQYKLREEFANATAVQVGSFTRNNGHWDFQAVGAGSNVELGEVLDQYK